MRDKYWKGFGDGVWVGFILCTLLIVILKSMNDLNML